MITAAQAKKYLIIAKSADLESKYPGVLDVMKDHILAASLKGEGTYSFPAKSADYAYEFSAYFRMLGYKTQMTPFKQGGGKNQLVLYWH